MKSDRQKKHRAMRTLFVNYIFLLCFFRVKSMDISCDRCTKNAKKQNPRCIAGGYRWPMKKNRIAYTTAIFWWFRWRTKKWNGLYYGEILVVPMSDQKVESPILRRDSGGSEERPKSEIAYTTVRSWWLKKWNSLYYGEILVFPRGH